MATPVHGKAVLVGGECDGQVVRLNFDPPNMLTVLIDEPKMVAPFGYAPDDTRPEPIEEAFVAPVNAFPAAAAGRPVTYVRFPVVGVPAGSRVHVYVPEGTPGAPQHR